MSDYIDRIDRIAPTRRPAGRVTQRPGWHDLTFLHWRVPPAVLRPLVPAMLEIDTFEGDAFIGLVPFTMTKVRPWWAPPLPGINNFHETNVRTYVHHRGARPGVWFLSLDAASFLAVIAARVLWRLPYHQARMTLEKRDGEVRYASERKWPGPLPGTCRVRCRPLGEPAPAQPGTLEHFLAERYLLYTSTRRGGLLCGAVHHTPYPLQPAEVLACEETLIAAAGIVRPAEVPIAHYASEVAVEIFALERVA
ncbi:MAG TPA: DUF2071 domain-containing protein [Kofleriaceae bacterium]|nr:DUF2071 domain-containing protein [Kofleriaceae bacterium]